MKTILIVIAVLIVLGGGYYWYAQRTPVDVTNPPAGESAPSQDRLNIRAVCESALAYMTFPDAASAERFLAECEAGEHPEVVERYRTEMNYGDGATI